MMVTYVIFTHQAAVGRKINWGSLREGRRLYATVRAREVNRLRIQPIED